MKKLFCLLIAVTSLQFLEAMTEKDAIDALEGFGDKCVPKPSEEDYKNMVHSKEDVPKSTKCFRLCLMNKLELLTEDCKLDGVKLLDLLSMVFEGKEKDIAEITNICNAQVECKDKCDAAHDFSMCILKEFKKREWSMPELDKEEQDGSR